MSNVELGLIFFFFNFFSRCFLCLMKSGFNTLFGFFIFNVSADAVNLLSH